MMNNFHFVGTSNDYIVAGATELPTPRDIAVDFETGEILTDESGQVRIVEGVEAIKVWAYLAIKTQRDQHQIFTENYGSRHEELIGLEYTKELTESEAYRYIKECLMENPYILNVKNLGVYKKEDKLKINIDIETIYGTDNLKGVA